MMRLDGVSVCMVTSAHPPNDARILHKEALSLAGFGAKVTIIYPSYHKEPEPFGNLRFKPFPAKRGFARAYSLLSLRSALRNEQFDVLHCHEPDALIAAINARGKSKIIYDSHELWSGVFAYRLFPQQLWSLGAKLGELGENRLLKKVDGAIGATHAITERLNKVVAPEFTTTLLNVPKEDVWSNLDAKRPARSERIWFCLEGNAGRKRGLGDMLEAIARTAVGCDVGLLIVGKVRDAERGWFASACERLGIGERVRETGWLDYKDVGKEIAKCDAGVVCFPDNPNNRICGPNKCFNYLMFGLPVIGPAFPRSHLRVLGDEGCAKLYTPGSIESLSEAMTLIATDDNARLALSQRATMLSREKYRWECMEVNLLALYERVLGRCMNSDSQS